MERRIQMRQYELILIVQPDLDEDVTKGVIDRVSNLITDNGGEVLKMDLWGSKKLAYEIKDFREGFYVYMDVQLEPSFCSEFNTSMSYIEPIIRHALKKR